MNAITSRRFCGTHVIARNPCLAGLQCLRCDATFPLTPVHAGCPVCAAGGVYVSLRAYYTNKHINKNAVPHNLPYTSSISLGEGNTPLLNAAKLAQAARIGSLHIKDESKTPTDSHKDRMSAFGVTQALDFGAHTVVLASSGNAAVSAARYAQATGLACEVATYSGMPTAYADELDALGAKRFMSEDNAGRWAFIAQRAALPGYFALTNHHMPALGSAPLASGAALLSAGKIRALGVSNNARMVTPALRDVPTFTKLGVKDLVLNQWWALVVPITTPISVLDKLRANTVAALASAGVQVRMSTLGIDLKGTSRDELRGFMRSKSERWQTVARDVGLKPQ